MKRIIRLIPLAYMLPFVALAQGELTEVTSFMDNIVKFINGTLVPFIFALAFLTFLWGVANFFIIGRDAEQAKEKGKEYMLWGIGGFVVMVSVWGIVNLISGGISLDDENIQNIPNINLRNN